MNKLNTQRQERAAVGPSPSQLTFLPGMGLAAAHTEELAQLPTFSHNTISTSKDSIAIVKKQQFTSRNRKLVKSRVTDLQEQKNNDKNIAVPKKTVKKSTHKQYFS